MAALCTSVAMAGVDPRAMGGVDPRVIGGETEWASRPFMLLLSAKTSNNNKLSVYGRRK